MAPTRPVAPVGSLYAHGFARIAAAVPHSRPAEPEFNGERTLTLARRASDAGAALVIFPELGLSSYTVRFGYAPSKVAFLAHHAWHDRDSGPWPDLIPEQRRHEYALAEINCWLAVFLERFFKNSQFKRSAIPNAPKVGSGGSLSPRGDWRAPSDSAATTWLAELREHVPDEPEA